MSIERRLCRRLRIFVFEEDAAEVRAIIREEVRREQSRAACHGGRHRIRAGDQIFVTAPTFAVKSVDPLEPFKFVGVTADLAPAMNARAVEE